MSIRCVSLYSALVEGGWVLYCWSFKGGAFINYVMGCGGDGGEPYVYNDEVFILSIVTNVP